MHPINHSTTGAPSDNTDTGGGTLCLAASTRVSSRMKPPGGICAGNVLYFERADGETLAIYEENKMASCVDLVKNFTVRTA